MKRIFQGKKGFTLVELLVVVGILGVLAAVVIPNVSKFVGSGTTSAANTEEQNVQAAVDAAMADLSYTSVVVAASCADFAVCQIDNGVDALPGTADDILLYPDYLRIQTPGDSRTYTWDATGLVSSP